MKHLTLGDLSSIQAFLTQLALKLKVDGEDQQVAMIHRLREKVGQEMLDISTEMRVSKEI